MKSSRLTLSTLLVLSSIALAQDGSVKRAIIDRVDTHEGSEAVFASAELALGSALELHRHHGIEIGYVTQGEIEVLVSGELGKRYRKGDSYRIAAGKAHSARNVGQEPASVVGVWLVEKGKPFSQAVN